MVNAVKSAGAKAATELEVIEFPGAAKGAVRRALTTAMQDGAAIAVRHASQELAMAQNRVAATRKATFAPLDNETLLRDVLPYIEGRAYTGTGMLVTDAENIARSAVLNGIKAGSDLETISNDVYAQLSRAGFLSAEDLAEVTGLDEAALAEMMGDAELTLGRVRTAVRTNVFDAFNEARFDYFTDPSLNGFVEALEYSAILDDNTTDICEELDGSTYPADSDFWSQYTPPNHFNCRSILIPLVQGDTWTESDAPSVEPQAGFGG
jgi:SPP1 gp7 family putative phage head morphogenesis protein